MVRSHRARVRDARTRHAAIDSVEPPPPIVHDDESNAADDGDRDSGEDLHCRHRMPFCFGAYIALDPAPPKRCGTGCTYALRRVAALAAGRFGFG